MASPFLHNTKRLLDYKWQMIVATIGLAVSTVSFAGGLGTVLLILKLLLQEGQTLKDLVRHGMIERPDASAFVQSLGQALLPYIPDDRFAGFVLIMVFILLLTAIGATGRFLHEVLTITVASRVTMVWRDRIYQHLIKAPALVMSQAGYSDWINRLVTDTRTYSDGLQTIIGRVLSELLKMIAAVVVALFVDWKIACLALFGVPVMLVLFRKIGKKIRRATKAAMSERGRMIAALNEALGGLAVVKVHNAEGYERRRFRRLAKSLFGEEMAMRTVKAYSSPFVEFLTVLGLIMLATLAAWLIIHRHSDPEHFIAVLALLGVATSSLKPISAFNVNYHEAAAAADRLAEMETLPIEQTAEPEHRHPALPRHHRDVRFENVAFQYPGAVRFAVEEAMLTAQFGQTIAIVGANGSGKSSLLNLLPRLAEPTRGRVLVDGIDISTVSLRSLRQQIAVVSQHTVLFQASIGDNIAYGRRYESRQRIIAAAQSAFAHEFITALPKGYDTLLGEDGTGLSGGQRQRLCIARAILRDPAILILDEATSQIDADSEAKINRAMQKLRHGRTIFIIAHRLSTVVEADMIVVMDDGKIVDRGLHRELLSRCQIYQVLTQTQLLPPAA